MNNKQVMIIKKQYSLQYHFCGDEKAESRIVLRAAFASVLAFCVFGLIRADARERATDHIVRRYA